MSWNKLKNILNVFLLVVFLFAFFFVKDALETDDIKVQEKEEDTSELIQEKPIRISINVPTSTQNSKTLDLRVNNTQSVLDLFSELIEKNEFIYEVNEYTYGYEFTSVNSIKPPENKKWVLYVTLEKTGVEDQIKNLHPSKEDVEFLRNSIDKKVDITSNFDQIPLVDNAKYEFVLENIE